MWRTVLVLTSFLLQLSVLSATDISWTAPVTVSSPGENASLQKITIDAQGNVVVVWVGSGVVKANVKLASVSWSGPTSLSGAGSTSPQLLCDSSGNVVAAWVDSGGIIKAASLPVGGSWSASSTLSSSGAESPSLAVDASGDFVLGMVQKWKYRMRE